MKNKKLTHIQIIEVCRLYKENSLKIGEIGNIFNVSQTTIWRILKENDMEFKFKVTDAKSGDKFGRLTIIKEVEKRKGRRFCLCQCSCANKTIKEFRLSHLTSGKIRSCGCLRKERTSERLLNSGANYAGIIFGKLTILYEVERAKNRARQVVCRCSCNGNIKKYLLGSLKGGTTKSCGCYAIERVKESTTLQLKDYQEKHPFFCQVEAVRDSKLGIETQCKYCGSWFKPTRQQIRSRIRTLENPTSLGIENHLYCSDKCKKLCPLYRAKFNALNQYISPQNKPSPYELAIWAEEIFKKQREEYGYNFCVRCQSTEKLFAHHIDPKKIEPFFALDPENGIIFCKDCHYDNGHVGECSTGKLARVNCNKDDNPCKH